MLLKELTPEERLLEHAGRHVCDLLLKGKLTFMHFCCYGRFMVPLILTCRSQFMLLLFVLFRSLLSFPNFCFLSTMFLHYLFVCLFFFVQAVVLTSSLHTASVQCRLKFTGESPQYLQSAQQCLRVFMSWPFGLVALEDWGCVVCKHKGISVKCESVYLQTSKLVLIGKFLPLWIQQ